MTELLAPAGSMEALKAAVSNGCNAVYLGMQKFGARAYSSNFDVETLREAIEYAHLRDVKVYVTMNTIVFEDEIEDMQRQLDLINDAGADGVIVQDLAVFDYVIRNFEDLEAHCSTQMGLDDLEGVLLMKSLGAKRVVLARELEIDQVKAIKKEADIPVEIFIHGALCVSFSGNCLMSGLTGYRCGNRGRCVGSCRKLYDLIDETEGKSLGQSYILSTRDLNTIDYIDQLRGVDSLKIEGRMKEPVYVANVVSKYRKALDGTLTETDREELYKTFNRTYTKGYLFGEDRKDIANIQKPNNFGYEIGTVTGAFKGGKYEITLKKVLNQNDMIRIDNAEEEINLPVSRLYGKDGRLINSAEKVCYIKIKEKLSVGDVVYKTKDYQYNKELEAMLDCEFQKFPLDMKVYAYPDSNLVIAASGLGLEYTYESDEPLGLAINKPTSREQIIKQLSRLNDTIFALNDVEFEEYDAFIPVKMLNNARREIVQGLYKAKVNSKLKRVKDAPEKEKFTFSNSKPYLTASVTTRAQYEACRNAGIKEIYFDNIIRRNQNDYVDRQGQLLIGGYGGIWRYRGSNDFVTDYSMNVVNAASCRELFRLGAKRVTLSYEMNRKQIGDLVNKYRDENGGDPALEMIVFGRTPLLVTKYCPLKEMGQCGLCRKKSYRIEDPQGAFPIVAHEDCTNTVLNGKILNLLDEMASLEGIEAFRLNFTTESPQEVERVVSNALGKLDGTLTRSVFNKETDTRGHFNKEIL